MIEEFDIDNRVKEEMLAPTPYPLSIAFPGYNYLILHFPTTDDKDGTRSQEVDFIAGRNFFITARYEAIGPLHNLHKVFESEELLGYAGKCTQTGQVLERILCKMYEAISDEIDLAARKLERIERDIFSGNEERAVRTISETGRALLRFETALARHREPLSDFLAALGTPAFFGMTFDEHAARIEGRRAHAAAMVSSYRDVANELRLTNDSMLSATQNQITRTLTVVAFIAMPLTLIASIFGMNTPTMPLVEHTYGFWIILGLMGLAAIALYLFFRSKRWL